MTARPDQQRIIRMLQGSGVIVHGHFSLPSGLPASNGLRQAGQHTDTWFYGGKLIAWPPHLLSLCAELAKGFTGMGISLVVGPTATGVAVAAFTALELYKLTTVGRVQAAFADKQPDASFKFRPEFAESINGAEILIAEDTVHSGNTIRQLVKAIMALGGNVAGVAVIWNRGHVAARDFTMADLPGFTEPEFLSLVDLDLPAWPAEGCELCSQGIPLVAV